MIGFYLNEHGAYIDFESDSELEVFILEHSTYGTIKYVIIDDIKTVVQHWFEGDLPNDWEGEL